MARCFTVVGQNSSAGIRKNSDSNMLYLGCGTPVVVQSSFYFSQPSLIERAGMIEQKQGFSPFVLPEEAADCNDLLVLWTPDPNFNFGFRVENATAKSVDRSILVRLSEFSTVIASRRAGLGRISWQLRSVNGMPVVSRC
ncbi:MAG: hypothetical protein SFV17_12630 [Candidatus Obscuribacter sp.]|nr:hypothetical protein [Candidatus Obscuribacter sp.]